MSYTRVSNLTYRTGRDFERYAVNGVGIGRGFSDYDEMRVGIVMSLVPRAVLVPYVAYRRQGEGDYRQPFPVIASGSIPPGFLSGVVSRVTRVAISGASSGGSFVEVNGDVGVNHVTNFAHSTGRRRTTVEGRVRASVELPARWHWVEIENP